MRTSGHLWLDAEAGPVVRPYAMLSGRGWPAGDGVDPATLLVTTGTAGEPPFALQPEQSVTLVLLRRPQTVVEVAAHLDLPPAVVRVLLGDLLAHGLVTRYIPPEKDQFRVLQALHEGLRDL
jgi:hypothetical protein